MLLAEINSSALKCPEQIFRVSQKLYAAVELLINFRIITENVATYSILSSIFYVCSIFRSRAKIYKKGRRKIANLVMEDKEKKHRCVTSTESHSGSSVHDGHHHWERPSETQ